MGNRVDELCAEIGELAEEVKVLAVCSRGEYETRRKKFTKKSGWRFHYLDKTVRRMMDAMAEDEESKELQKLEKDLWGTKPFLITRFINWLSPPETSLTIFIDNTVYLDGEFIGQIDRSSYAICAFRSTFTPEGGGAPVQITAPSYIGGPDNWTINPEFEAEVMAACGISRGAAS